MGSVAAIPVRFSPKSSAIIIPIHKYTPTVVVP
jgi:hypothetical protein